MKSRKHLTSLVKNQVRNTLQISVALLKMINQSTRSSDDDLNPRSQIANLTTLGYTAIDDGIFDVRR